MCRNAPVGGLAGAGSGVRFLMAGLVGLLTGAGGKASGHEVLATQIQHLGRIEAGATHLDLTFELVFHETASFAERRRMDRDRNGRITSEEGRRYLEELAPELERGLGLSVDGREVDLVTLHEPQVDLRGVEVVVPSPHVLTLRMFARTPPHFREGSRLQIRDGLWAAVPALHAVECRGSDGIRLEVENRVTWADGTGSRRRDGVRVSAEVPAAVGQGGGPNPGPSAGGTVFTLRWVPAPVGSRRELGPAPGLQP